MKISGKIKSMLIKCVNKKADDKDEDDFLSEIPKNDYLLIYDKKGNLVYLKELNDKKEAISTFSYLYDDKNRIIEGKCEEVGEDSSSTTTCLYDNYNNIIELTDCYDDNSFHIRVESVTNKKGQIIASRSFENDVLVSKKYLFYYPNGFLKEEKSYKPNSKQYFSVQYKYDKQGRKTEEKSFNRALVEVSREETKYDEYGNIAELIRCGKNNKFNYKESYKYDKFGNNTECLHIDSKKKSQKNTYEHKYDEHNNIIETKHYLDSELISITCYEIEYYD